jgi:hypothetical protein|eukprot:SAG25_NODE_638_length_6258_cov_5.099692_4_plen_76_part_00
MEYTDTSGYGAFAQPAHHPYYNAFSGRDTAKHSHHHHTSDQWWTIRVKGPGLDKTMDVVEIVEMFIEQGWDTCLE